MPAGADVQQRWRAGYVAPFILIHLACGLVVFTGVSRDALAVCVATYALQAFGLTGGFHRYFSHRSFRTSRAFQCVLAVLGTLAVQKGVLWWAANHRRHHQHADRDGDPHSPRGRGLWWAHSGWFLAPDFETTEWALVRDWTTYSELVWLNEHYVWPPVVLASALAVFGGLSWFVWGFCISTTLTWHLTYAINSLGHRYGSRRYDTSDTSRNNFWLALLTWGEGWHNNHHRFARAARQGRFWWEIDLTYYLIVALSYAGVVWAIVEPPRRLADAATQRGRARPTLPSRLPPV